MAKRLLRREHVVAASLVGAVVVVVGYASGLGTLPVTASEAPSEDDPVAAAPPPGTQAPTQETQPQTGTPEHHSGGGGSVPVVNPPGTGHTGHPAPPTTPPSTPPPTPPGPDDPDPENPCAPGLVPRSLDTLLDTLTRATDTIDLLDDVSLASIGLTPTTVPTLVNGTTGNAVLDQFLATCGPATPTAPVTTTVAPLPLLGG